MNQELSLLTKNRQYAHSCQQSPTDSHHIYASLVARQSVPHSRAKNSQSSIPRFPRRQRIHKRMKTRTAVTAMTVTDAASSDATRSDAIMVKACNQAPEHSKTKTARTSLESRARLNLESNVWLLVRRWASFQRQPSGNDSPSVRHEKLEAHGLESAATDLVEARSVARVPSHFGVRTKHSRTMRIRCGSPVGLRVRQSNACQDWLGSPIARPGSLERPRPCHWWGAPFR